MKPPPAEEAAPSRPFRLPLREGLLLAGFVLLLAAAVVSVVLPELGRDPESEAGRSADAGVPPR